MAELGTARLGWVRLSWAVTDSVRLDWVWLGSVLMIWKGLRWDRLGGWARPSWALLG